MQVVAFQTGLHPGPFDASNLMHVLQPLPQFEAAQDAVLQSKVQEMSLPFQAGLQGLPLGCFAPASSGDPVANVGAKPLNFLETPLGYQGLSGGQSVGRRPLRIVPVPQVPMAPVAQAQGPPRELPKQQAVPSAVKERPPSLKAMLSEEMETQMAQLSDRSSPHVALGRSPEDVSAKVQVISLGCSCGVKMTIRRLGLDEATMPFDWIRSSSQGILQWLGEDFTEYFRSPFHRVELTFRDVNMTVYRSPTHSFWHDDLEQLDTREKLWRRVQRFLALDKDGQHVPARDLLFVRCCVATSEVSDSEYMYTLLQAHFEKSGRNVWLLVIIDEQDRVGPILHSKFERLLFWVKPLFRGKLEIAGQGPGPYEDAIAFACRRILQDPEGLMPGGQAGNGTWPQIASTAEIVNPGGPLQIKQSEAGLWCGMVLKKDALEETMFAAFEGHSNREIAYPAKV